MKYFIAVYLPKDSYLRSVMKKRDELDRTFGNFYIELACKPCIGEKIILLNNCPKSMESFFNNTKIRYCLEIVDLFHNFTTSDGRIFLETKCNVGQHDYYGNYKERSAFK